MIEKAKQADLSQIIEVIESARAFLKAQGLDQWQTSAYPSSTDVLSDIEKGVGYVLRHDGVLAGYAAVITGFEPAYDQLKGAWLNHNRDYVTVHRLAISSQVRGQSLGQKLFTDVFETFDTYTDFRVDTHPDNQIMQHILTKLGFESCGIVIYEGERVAYQKLISRVSDIR